MMKEEIIMIINIKFRSILFFYRNFLVYELSVFFFMGRVFVSYFGDIYKISEIFFLLLWGLEFSKGR